MKTSLELSENLFRRAKSLARKRGTTLRALIEDGLRRVLTEGEAQRAENPKVLTFGGEGFAEGFKENDLRWDSLRKHVYPE